MLRYFTVNIITHLVSRPQLGCPTTYIIGRPYQWFSLGAQMDHAEQTGYSTAVSGAEQVSDEAT